MTGPRRHPRRSRPLLLALLSLLLLAACAPPATTPTPVVPTPAPVIATPTTPAPDEPPTPTASPTPTATGDGLPLSLTVGVANLLAEYEERGVARAGIVIKDGASGEALRINPDAPFPAASLYKLFVLWAVQVAIRDGQLADTTALVLTPATDDSEEDGYRLGDYGDTIPLDRARELMITASNNTAAWLLVAALGGWAAVEGPLRANEFTDTETSPELLTTAREVTRFFEGVTDGTLDPALGPADYALMLALLRDQSFNDYLSPALPPAAPFAHKTGNVDLALHDAGALFLPSGRVIYLTVLTEGDYRACRDFMRDLAALITATLGE